MTVTFSFRVIDMLINRAQRVESASCGLDTEATDLLSKLSKLKVNPSYFAYPETITLTEAEAKTLGLL